MTAVTERGAGLLRRDRPGRLHAALPFVPAFALIAAWVWWMPHDGGYFPRAWYPAGLFAAALLLCLALARPSGSFARSPATLPLALLAAWTGWNAISLLWSPAPGAGREATNELLTVLVMGAVVAATPWRARSVLAVIGVWAAGIAVLGAADLVTFALEPRPEGRLLEGRYLGPTGYANATAAVGAMAFWPLLALSARPATPALVRVAALPAAVVVLLWALLPQSRGMMFAGAAALPLFLALSPDRVRSVTRLVVVGGALLLCAPDLFEVYTAAREQRPVGGIVDAAVTRVAVAAALALAAGLALLAIERAVRPGPRAVAAGRRVAQVTAVVALIAGVVALAATQGRIRESLADRWETFSSDASVENTQTGPRVGQVLADRRYDYWTVALDEFRGRPVTGIGAAGFEPRYTAQKRYEKHSRYVHDIWLRALSETGVVGLALLAGMLLAGLAGLVRGRIRGPAEAHAAIAATAALSTAFFLQCSLDWLEELPALLAPAVGLPLAALRAVGGREGGAPPWRRTAPAIALAVVAVAALVPPYLAVRHIERGDALRATDTSAAVAAYERAAGADPLSLVPHLRTGFVGVAAGDPQLARRGFRDALDVQETWVAHFELGLLDAQDGRFRAARAHLRRAAELNANDPLVTDALAAVEDGERLDPREVNAQAVEQPVLAVPR